MLYEVITGVSEVASVGGFVKEYQVDINPDAMKAYNVSVMDVMNAVSNSNLDIGAETIELNVITSYSIHYTKLYDCPGSSGINHGTG